MKRSKNGCRPVDEETKGRKEMDGRSRTWEVMCHTWRPDFTVISTGERDEAGEEGGRSRGGTVTDMLRGTRVGRRVGGGVD